MSEFVGGIANYQLLLEDARAYDDVMLIMAAKNQGEAKAARIQQTRFDAGKR